MLTCAASLPFTATESGGNVLSSRTTNTIRGGRTELRAPCQRERLRTTTSKREALRE